ncbi:MAG: DegT/DnrJ/EryC1/StrS family aminotransferase [Desulfarculus sp.]|nr:DegT/DnrJ/EryC1/StrS family aminotransferase [Desulfarculus sp.]
MTTVEQPAPLPAAPEPIPIAKPSLGPLEAANVAEAVASTWISSTGPFVERLEAGLADLLGAPHVLCTSNGTTALHLALAGLGIGPGDEVLVPDLTFAATANAVFMAGATPVLVDCAADHWNADAAAFARGISPRTKALMVVHLLGQACRMEPILEFARNNNLLVVEDCAESLGADCGGQPTGSFGAVGCFSFFANKVLTTGEGGAVATSDPDLAKRMRRLRAHGMDPQRQYWHDSVGFNYRMTNLNAALGVAQLQRLEELLARRRVLAQRYQSNLAGLSWLRSGFTAPGRSIDWLHPLFLAENILGLSRDQVLDRLHAAGIDARPMFYPLHLLPPYRNLRRAGELDRATDLGLSGLMLPLYPDLREDQVDYICAQLTALGRKGA